MWSPVALSPLRVAPTLPILSWPTQGKFEVPRRNERAVSRFAALGGLGTLQRENSSGEDVMANGENENPVPQAAADAGRMTPVAPIWHTVLLLVVVIGLSALQARPQIAAQASRLPSRLSTYILTLGYECVLLGYVWLIALLRYKVPLAEIIGGKWQRWGDFWRDVGIALLFWLAVLGMLIVASFTLHFSGVEAAKGLLPKTNLELAVFVVLSTFAGFCEEIVFRGYLQRQFTAWTRNVAMGVVLQAIVFGSAHMYQGAKGVLVISIYGALFGILAAMRKTLRPGMMQHCAQDGMSGIVYHLATKYKIVQMIQF